MPKIYHIHNGHEWSTDKLHRMLAPLPDDMQKKILTYRDWQDRQSRILSKHLLLRLLQQFKVDMTLADIKYTQFHKPYFDFSPLLGKGAGGGVHFSTAHSGALVVCAAALDTIVGIDIEQVLPVDIDDYREQLTTNEWHHIQNSSDRLIAFYQIWTRKEALLKLLGRGVDLEFDSLDVSADVVSYDGEKYYLYPLTLAEGYIAHIATSAPSDSGSVSSEMLSDLLSARP